MQTLWCLHGNLQQPVIWQSVVSPLQAIASPVELQLVNLWETLSDSCWSWSKQFCSTVQASIERNKNAQHYLLGYSLGGRLGLHALVAQPELWSGAIIVSADPGAVDQSQKEQCLKRDRTWANRFLTEPWDDLLAEWDALPVFCGYPSRISRPESDFDRHKIAAAFVNYSKGAMDDLTPRLSQTSVPITYVTGDDDSRYCQLGQILMTHHSSLNHVKIPGAGHRVPWEQPQQFAQILCQTLAN